MNAALSTDADDPIWQANLAAIHRRWPEVADGLAAGVTAGVSSVDSIETATAVVSKVTPSGACTEPLLIAGGDLAVWAAVYQLPCKSAVATHRPPLYLLARQVTDLAALRALDCVAMFSDPRTQLFVGEDAVAQAQEFQFSNPQIPAAQTSITIDSRLFSLGESAAQLWPKHLARCDALLQQLEDELSQLRSRLLNSDRPKQLRVLGISSRYTTFLQYSMRDWLESLRELGHETEFIIESFDHELANPISLAQAALQFRPDLIVMIDHYRGELRGMPQQVPFVMWVQDELNNIFDPKAGAAQGPLDFCLGFGRLHLRDKCGYPEQRFLSTPVGVNIRRFAPASEQTKPTCDLSFVSNASAPATSLLETQLQRADANARKVLIEVFEWLKASYDGDGCISHLSLISRFIDQTLDRHGIRLAGSQRQGIDDFFITRINNALFRHQTLSWAAGSGLRLQLWGRGWEQHGRLRRFAKGVACNQSQLREIYQHSAINLQIVPTGAVHQRLLDGLAAGGFFMLRETAGDRVETHYKQIWNRLAELRLTTSAAIKASADPVIQSALAAIERLLGVSPFNLTADLMDVVRLSADCGFTRSAESVWSDYSSIAFNSREQFLSRAQHFISHAEERQAIADRMRGVVVDRFSYDATNRELLGMINRQLNVPRTIARAA